jgi:hypothetical protein
MVERRSPNIGVTELSETQRKDAKVHQMTNESTVPVVPGSSTTTGSFENETESEGTRVCVLAVGFRGQMFAKGIKASVPCANVVSLSPSDSNANRIQTALSNAHFVIIAITGAEGVEPAVTITRLAKSRGILPLTIWGGAENAPAALATQVVSWVSMRPMIARTNCAMEGQGSPASASPALSMQYLVSDVWKLINVPHFVGVDIEDVRHVTGLAGPGLCGFGQASGPGRAVSVTEQLLRAGTFRHIVLKKARGVLVCIAAASGSLKLQECKQVMNIVRSMASTDADVIYGTAEDDALRDELRVSVLATGFSESSRNWSQVDRSISEMESKVPPSI